MMQTTRTTWHATALAALRQDPKRTGVLIVLLVLMTLLWVRAMGPGKSRPADAAAATTSMSGGSRDGSGNRGGGASVMRSANAHAHLQRWSEGPVTSLSRNLFSVQLDYFPVDGPRNERNTREQGDDGFWARLEKSLVLQADQRDKRENQIANYRTQANRLRLQSTMMGPQPKAMINGELVGEGDVVAEFRVVKIEARRIIVEREGIRLEILMK